MKVVLDTNVVVSGTFWTGASFKVLQLMDRELVTVIVSPSILEEYDRIVHSEEILDKTTIYQHARIHVIQKILTKAVIVEPKIHLNCIKDDPDDNKFVEAAKEGEADIIVSNDKHLLDLKEYGGIRILTPEEFLKIV